MLIVDNVQFNCALFWARSGIGCNTWMISKIQGAVFYLADNAILFVDDTGPFFGMI
jgi:hypothetical protein